jgi:hypothetical protein
MGKLILRKSYLQYLKESGTFISSFTTITRRKQVNPYIKLQMVLSLLVKHSVIFREAKNEDVQKEW